MLVKVSGDDVYNPSKSLFGGSSDEMGGRAPAARPLATTTVVTVCGRCCACREKAALLRKAYSSLREIDEQVNVLEYHEQNRNTSVGGGGGGGSRHLQRQTATELQQCLW